jgi:hypothetical protein
MQGIEAGVAASFGLCALSKQSMGSEVALGVPFNALAGGALAVSY